MKLLKLFLAVILFSSCNRNDDYDFEKYPYFYYPDYSENENIFFNQAVKYLHLNFRDYPNSVVKVHSMSIEYYFYSTVSDTDIRAHKYFYKSDSSSILYKTVDGIQTGYVYQFDHKDRLQEVKDYSDFNGKLLNQWIEFDSVMNIGAHSHFILVSPDTILPSDSSLEIYIYPFKTYIEYGLESEIIVTNDHLDTIYNAIFNNSKDKGSIPVLEEMKRGEFITLFVSQKYRPPDFDGKFASMTIKKKIPITK